MDVDGRGHQLLLAVLRRAGVATGVSEQPRASEEHRQLHEAGSAGPADDGVRRDPDAVRQQRLFQVSSGACHAA